LARHLGQFGEIRITRLEPETAVAWEGENASGTVRLEPSGWGTRVILTARQLPSDPPNDPPTSEAAPIGEPAPALVGVPCLDPASDREPASGLDPASDPLPPAPRSRLLGRLFGFLRRTPAASATPAEPPAGMAGAVEEPPVAEPAVVEPPVVEPPQSDTAMASATPTLNAVGENTRPETAAAPDEIDSQAALDCALDSLGQAHHRPFSRA
jgi:hypothetical protein